MCVIQFLLDKALRDINTVSVLYVAMLLFCCPAHHDGGRPQHLTANKDWPSRVEPYTFRKLIGKLNLIKIQIADMNQHGEKGH